MKDNILHYIKLSLKLLLFYLIVSFLAVLAYILTSGILFILWNDGLRYALMMPYVTFQQTLITVACLISLIVIIKHTNNIFYFLFKKKKDL